MTNQDEVRVPPPGQIDPAWWTAVLPASPLNSPVDIDDVLGPPGWQIPEIVSREIRDLAASAPPGSTQHKLLSALADASSAMLEPEDWAEPFRPFASWADGSRSVLPSDIDEERMALLATAAPLIENVPMRARVADVAWTYGDKTDMKMLGLALDAYLATPLEHWAWHTISKDAWQRAVEVLQRRGKAEAERRTTALSRILHRVLDGTATDGFMLIDLADLYRRAGSGDDQTTRRLANHFVALAASTDNPRLSRHYERTAHRFLTAVGENDDAHEATQRIAESYAIEADQRLASDNPSEMAAGMDIEKAIATLRALPRKYRLALGVDGRIEQLRGRLDQTREATLDAMQAFDTEPVDITQSVRAAERAVTGRPKLEALVRVATIQSLTDHDQAIAEAREGIQGGIARLFARATYAGDGRKVASSMGAVGEPEAEELWSHVVRYFGIRVGLVVNARVMPALDIITVEHRYDMAFLRRICWDSPTVPPAHVDLWARGLWHGLNGDFPSAISVLLPQVEQLLRYHLKQAGTNTLFVDPATGVEMEKGLNTLLVLEESREFLGPDLQIELRALLVEQEGANLRNDVAHGLLTDAAAWSTSSVYAWWLLLRIVVVPLWTALEGTSPLDDEVGQGTNV